MSQEERNEVKIKRSAYRKKRISSLTPAEQKEEKKKKAAYDKNVATSLTPEEQKEKKKKKAAYDAEYSKKRAQVSFQSSDQ